MSKNTNNLKMFVYEPSDDGSQTFNITRSISENFELLDKMLNVYAYDSTFTYSTGMYVLDNGILYRSKTNNNTGNALSNTTYWEIKLYNNTQELMTALVQRKSTSSATGDGSTPVYVKADGTVEVCNYGIENTRFSSTWTYKLATLITDASAGAYEADLTDYLGVSANSTTQYEILFAHSYYSGSENAKKGIVFSDVIPETSVYVNNNQYGSMIATDQGRTSGYLGIIPVKTKIKMRLHNSFTTNILYAVGYKRLGTNE